MASTPSHYGPAPTSSQNISCEHTANRPDFLLPFFSGALDDRPDVSLVLGTVQSNIVTVTAIFSASVGRGSPLRFPTLDRMRPSGKSRGVYCLYQHHISE
jgi:hypothetical protein